MLSFTAMEEFDFNAPIDATVIFDDDTDEETNVSTEKVQNRSENGSSASLCVIDLVTQGKDIISRLSETVDRIQTFESTEYNVNVLETTNNCYAVAKGNITNEAKSKEKPLDMPSLEEETTMTLPGNTLIMPHSNNNQTDTQNNIHCLKQQKRKLSTYEKKPKRKRTTEKKSTEGYYNNAKISKPSVNIAENNQPNSHSYNQPQLNTEMPLSQPQIQNKEIEQQYTINIEASPISTKYFNQQQLNPEVPLSQTLNDQSILSNYLKELLNTVSEHMIYIVNSYHSYVRICKHCRDQSLIEHARNNYIRTKKHFFDLSYSSVLNIIIPKEDDVTFVKSFLDTTLNIAVSKSYNYTYIHVEPLFIEMIDWVKKRRDFIQKMDLNKIPNPLLLQQLQKPPLSIPPPTLPPPAYPGLEQQIHKPNTATNRNNILNTSMPLSQNLYTESLYNNQNGSSTIQSQNTEGYENQATYHFCQNGNFQSVIVRNEQQQQNYYDAQKMVPCEKQTTQLWEKEGMHPWQMQAWQKQVTQETGQKQATQQTWQKQATQQSWQKQAAQQSCQKQAALAWQNPGNLPTIQSFQRFQQADLTVNNQYVAPENQVEMNIRSSISRDSGFISPLNFSTSDQSLHQEEQRLQVTPFITHVTSLNPNASYITEGSCTVCGKSTKKKCLGCYKCYYCSHNCQYLDWKNHMAVCK